MKKMFMVVQTRSTQPGKVNRMSRILPLFLAVSTVMSLVPCGNGHPDEERLLAASAAAASAPVAASGMEVAPADEKTLVANFVQTSYHPDDVHTSQQCAFKRINTADGPRYLLAVCTHAKNGGHAESGLVDLYVLKAGSTGALEPVVKKIGIDSGAYGNTGKVTVNRLGETRYGFEIEDGDMHQGYGFSALSIWAPNDGGITHALSILTETTDGSEECAENQSKCHTMKLTLTPKTKVKSGIYPLEAVWVSGKTRRTFELLFDDAKHAYVVPDELNRLNKSFDGQY